MARDRVSEFVRTALATTFVLFIAGQAACARSPETTARASVQSDVRTSARAGKLAPDIVRIETATAPVRFRVEFVDTDERRSLGLMHRESLPADAGMLFDFGREPKVVSMWMKNTLISLDMAFIDENGVIVRIAERTLPLSLEPILSGKPVVAVLEVNAGALASAGVSVGDRVRHPMFEAR